jgi:hypothetical protein
MATRVRVSAYCPFDVALGIFINSVMESCGAYKGVVEAVPLRDDWLYELEYFLLLVGSLSVDTTLATSKKIVLLWYLDAVDNVNQYAKQTLLP